jgi:anti-sigma factor RsiW
MTSSRKDLPQRFSCDSELISRYHDDELDTEATAQVRRHLETCDACRKTLMEIKGISQVFRDRIHREGRTVAPASIDAQILSRITGKPRFSFYGFLKPLVTKKFVYPAAAAMAVLILVFTFFNPSDSTGPSAIINSFTGQVSSVMIIETPGQRHTILWFSEDAGSTEGSHAVSDS